MIRLVAMLVTAIACIGGGAAAGLLAFAFELSWPLSTENFAYAACLGAAYGVGGAVISGACLSVMGQRRLWAVPPIIVAATCLVAFACVWWDVVSSLG